MAGILSTSMRTHACGEISEALVGQEVTVCGWVAKRREHGEHLAFVDLRDHLGLVQCVVDGAADLRSEYVLSITGTVRLRPEGTINEKLGTGKVEIGDCSVVVLAEAEPPPIPIDGRTDADEAVRLRYRYVDLRQERLQRNLRLRSKVHAAIRLAMDRQGFCEVETPLLWAPTPEGSREFAVPSRLHAGKFYSLPQSPQLAKQLLMVGGLDRYYQIARCLRDEDLRADRQFEFTQLDMEASFVSAEDVMAFVSEAVSDAAELAVGERPTIASMTWQDALERYGTDKPDLRFGMELIALTDLFASAGIRAFEAPDVRGICLSGGAELSRSKLDGLVDQAKKFGAKGLAWFKVEESGTLASPIAKNFVPELLAKISERMEAKPGDLLLFVADSFEVTCKALYALRKKFGEELKLYDPATKHFSWVVEFPMFAHDEESGHWAAMHHPFTAPRPQDLELLTTDPGKCRAQAYDLVINGTEAGGGTIRIHDPQIQQQVFGLLGITPEQARERFGFLLDALAYGAPPHGGIALGIDRWVMLLAQLDNIRDCIAFPKTQKAADLMTEAPGPVDVKQLRELGVQIRDPEAARR
ncbi:MAG: aspartate--tRNA ligase [Actinomycetes bacterium]